MNFASRFVLWLQTSLSLSTLFLPTSPAPPTSCHLCVSKLKHSKIEHVKAMSTSKFAGGLTYNTKYKNTSKLFFSNIHPNALPPTWPLPHCVTLLSCHDFLPSSLFLFLESTERNRQRLRGERWRSEEKVFVADAVSGLSYVCLDVSST